MVDCYYDYELCQSVIDEFSFVFAFAILAMFAYGIMIGYFIRNLNSRQKAIMKTGIQSLMAKEDDLIIEEELRQIAKKLGVYEKKAK